MKFILYLSMMLSFACNRKTAAEKPEAVMADSASVPVVSAVSNNTTTPACILEKIESIKKEHVWNPPAEIHQYEYDGKKVYSISADCCDFFTTVVDADCNYICAPSGGFTGRGDGKCIDFSKSAKHIRLVWKDERSRK